MRSGVKLDNNYVVPYNRKLCFMFQAHINVDCCGSTMLIKYLFKYISKGTDRVATRISRPLGTASSPVPAVSQPVDEIQNFIDARFICPHDAFWLTYIHPAFGEAFFLRMLLCHKKGCIHVYVLFLCYFNVFLKGCRIFEDIRTVNEVVHRTYRSACEAIGLLCDDKEWATALIESSASASSSELHSLFAHMLVYCDVTNLLDLWEKHWKLMSDDIPLRAAASLIMSKLHLNTEDLHNLVLYEVEIILNQCVKSISDYALPDLPPNMLVDLANRVIMEEKNYDRQSLDSERVELECNMNAKQKQIYELVTNASFNQETELVFVSDHSGTGKTFLWKAIITTLRARGKIVLTVASSGIVGTPDAEDPENARWVYIPAEYCIPDDENGQANLVSFIYPRESLQNPSAYELQ
ncbi:uncharacterized protein [Rutidosis leptorrhynchoides]|uniref:uncharacterized protein n=1 Tax=Rutidosis leptorrhynchoides TaxID=125765 RepID=UPI003A997451